MKYFKLKYLIIALVVGFLASCFAAWQYWRVRDFIYEQAFAPSGPPIQTKAQIDEVLASFEKITFSQLPPTYLKQTQSNQAPFNKMLKGKSFYKLQKEDIYRKIVGNYRIKSFIAKDPAYKAHVMSWGKSEGLYWLVDKKLLYKFIELQHSLKEADYNPNGFLVVNGFRPPKYNKAIGGASKSRHIVGEAVDILVKDVNKDGKVTQADKTIILDLLDQEVIGIMGGIGRYPKTMSVHFDVRGYKARWDSY
jgi:hypothetical protein